MEFELQLPSAHTRPSSFVLANTDPAVEGKWRRADQLIAFLKRLKIEHVEACQEIIIYKTRINTQLQHFFALFVTFKVKLYNKWQHFFSSFLLFFFKYPPKYWRWCWGIIVPLPFPEDGHHPTCARWYPPGQTGFRQIFWNYCSSFENAARKYFVIYTTVPTVEHSLFMAFYKVSWTPHMWNGSKRAVTIVTISVWHRVSASG